MRLLLAKLLLQQPALLLLDEPTNHLDLDSLTWLEDFLQQYQGAIMLISHDRSFLDHITSTTWELSLGKLTVYRGNYMWTFILRSPFSASRRREYRSCWGVFLVQVRTSNKRRKREESMVIGSSLFLEMIERFGTRRQFPRLKSA